VGFRGGTLKRRRDGAMVGASPDELQLEAAVRSRVRVLAERSRPGTQTSVSVSTANHSIRLGLEREGERVGSASAAAPFVTGCCVQTFDVMVHQGVEASRGMHLPAHAPGELDEIMPIHSAVAIRLCYDMEGSSVFRLGRVRLGLGRLVGTSGEKTMAVGESMGPNPLGLPERGRPLIDEILDKVRAVCDPRTPNWQDALRAELERILFRGFEDGQLVTADDMNRIVAALQYLYSTRGQSVSAPTGGTRVFPGGVLPQSGR
jgi:hypothetical protein